MMAQQSADQVQSRNRCEVSIVLPLYNSERELPEALAELDKQSYRDREIVIVDDGSSDGTWDLANNLSAGRSDVVLVRTEHRGASHARNSGVERSNGSVIFFAESDCVYDDTYVQKAVEALNTNPNAGAVCLTGAPLITRSTLATRSIDIENKMQHALLNQGKIQPFYAWVYRKDAFDKVGGFDERLFQGEDKDLFSRLKKANYGVAWVPGINWRHKRDQTTLELASKWFKRGRTRVLFSIKHRHVFEILKTLVPFWALVLGFVLTFRYPLPGLLIVLLVALGFIVQSLRVTRISWGSVQQKSSFLEYPIFVVTRNFSMALGYTVALAAIAARKVEGRPVAWDNI